MEKQERYDLILQKVKALIDEEDDTISAMANISSVLYHDLLDINWAGFYRVQGKQLILGPFQGKPACSPILIGKGVCGTAAATGEIQCIENVHEFPGHIARDPDSNSEIVVPIIKNDTLVGVLDIDSNKYGTFDCLDARYLAQLLTYLP